MTSHLPNFQDINDLENQEPMKTFLSEINRMYGDEAKEDELLSTDDIDDYGADDDFEAPLFGDDYLDKTQNMLEFLIIEFMHGGASDFARFINEHQDKIADQCESSKTLKDIVIAGLELGIHKRNAECAIELGILYYTGEIVDQDFDRAKELYQIAGDLGNIQAIINLGYIYEYGRTGKRDYPSAFQCYSYAAAVADAPEALYKMGDIISRHGNSLSLESNSIGSSDANFDEQAFQRNTRAAFHLWLRSYQEADENEDTENQAQAAIRMAPFYLDEEKAEMVDVDVDPHRALELYMLAEIGIRLSIENGLTYYQPRLDEAIRGQEMAREALDEYLEDIG